MSLAKINSQLVAQLSSLRTLETDVAGNAKYPNSDAIIESGLQLNTAKKIAEQLPKKFIRDKTLRTNVLSFISLVEKIDKSLNAQIIKILPKIEEAIKKTLEAVTNHQMNRNTAVQSLSDLRDRVSRMQEIRCSDAASFGLTQLQEQLVQAQGSLPVSTEEVQGGEQSEDDPIVFEINNKVLDHVFNAQGFFIIPRNESPAQNTSTKTSSTTTTSSSPFVLHGSSSSTTTTSSSPFVLHGSSPSTTTTSSSPFVLHGSSSSSSSSTSMSSDLARLLNKFDQGFAGSTGSHDEIEDDWDYAQRLLTTYKDKDEDNGIVSAGAQKQICLHFVEQGLRMPLSTLHVKGIERLGLENHKNAVIPKTLRATSVSTKPFAPHKKTYSDFLHQLNDNRSGKTSSKIAAILTLSNSSCAVVLPENEGEVVIFFPVGNPKKDSENTNAYRTIFYTFDAAADYLVDMHLLLSKKPLSCTATTYVRSLTAEPSLDEPSWDKPVAPILEAQLFSLQEHVKITDKVALTKTFLKLQDIEDSIVKNLSGIVDEITLGDLVFLHLDRIIAKEAPDRYKRTVNRFGESAFAQLNECDSTPKERARAVHRARADVLLYELEQAYDQEKMNNHNELIAKVNRLCLDMQALHPEDIIEPLQLMREWDHPQDDNEDADGVIAFRLQCIQEARKAVSKIWG